jgi:hypothetical protein
MALGDGILGNVILGDTGSGGGVSSTDAALVFFSMSQLASGFILTAPEVAFLTTMTELGFILTRPEVAFSIEELQSGFTMTRP